MSEYEHWMQNDSNQKGPFPLLATLNGELKLHGQVQKYRDTLLRTGVGARALQPILLEVAVPDLRGSNIPEQFALAHGAEHAPVSAEYENATRGNRQAEREGVFCILPEPLHIGVSGLILWRKGDHGAWRADLNWYVDKLTLLADNPMEVLQPHEHTAMRIPWLGEITSTIPNVTQDPVLQATYESTIQANIEATPDSLDTVKELTPSVYEVIIRDGRSLDAFDYVTCSSFVKAASSISNYNPGFAKGTFAAIASHIANSELAAQRRTDPKAALATISRVGDIRQHLYWTTATQLSPTNPHRQLGLDYEATRDVALELIHGSLKLEGVGKKSIDFLRTMFDSPTK